MVGVMSLVTFPKRRSVSREVAAVMRNLTLSPLPLCRTGGERAGWPCCGGWKVGS